MFLVVGKHLAGPCTNLLSYLGTVEALPVSFSTDQSMTSKELLELC
jgi:hypothetical protein